MKRLSSSALRGASKARKPLPLTGAATANGEVDYGPLAAFIGFRLRVAQEASFRAFTRRVGDPHLKPSRFAILMLLDLNPGLTQTALGKACGRDKSTLTPALDELVKRGHVLRERPPTDRRSYTLQLTATGKKLLAHLTERAREHDRELDRIVGKKNKNDFLDALERIATKLARNGV